MRLWVSLCVLALSVGLIRLGYVSSTTYGRCEHARHAAHVLAGADAARIGTAAPDRAPAPAAPRSTPASSAPAVACSLHLAPAPDARPAALVPAPRVARGLAPPRLVDQHRLVPPDRPPRA